MTPKEKDKIEMCCDNPKCIAEHLKNKMTPKEKDKKIINILEKWKEGCDTYYDEGYGDFTFTEIGFNYLIDELKELLKSLEDEKQ